MPGSGADSWPEHDTLKRLVVDAAKQFAATVGVASTDDQRFEAAQRARVDAEHVLDDVSTLNMRKTLGPERWDKRCGRRRRAWRRRRSRRPERRRTSGSTAASGCQTRLITSLRNSSAASYAPSSAASWSRPARGRSPTAFTSSTPTIRSSCPGRAFPASPAAGLQRQFPRKRCSNRTALRGPGQRAPVQRA
jgi:hypothetical protein